MMARPPACQFYWADFTIGVSEMSAAAVGVYILALSHQWTHGSIPDDPVRVSRAIHIEAGDVWDEVRPKFELGKDGRLRNARLEAERAKQDEYRAAKVEAGRAGAAKRWRTDSTPNGTPNGSAIADPMADPMAEGMANGMAKNGVSSSSSSSSLTLSSTASSEQSKPVSGKPDDSAPKKVAMNGSRFPEFWSLYPKQVARKTCEGIWKRRKLDELADEIAKPKRQSHETRQPSNPTSRLMDRLFGPDGGPEDF